MKKTVVLMLIFCLLFCVSCNKSRTSDEIKGDQATDTLEVGGEPVENQKENIVLYFSDNQGMALSKEEREVSRDDATDAEFVMRELMKGCENPELISILPKDLVLNSCKVQDGICIVDMSEEYDLPSVCKLDNVACVVDALRLAKEFGCGEGLVKDEQEDHNIVNKSNTGNKLAYLYFDQDENCPSFEVTISSLRVLILLQISQTGSAINSL